MNNAIGKLLFYHDHFPTYYCLYDILFADDIKMEADIDTGKSKIDVGNDERISVDTFSANEKDEHK